MFFSAKEFKTWLDSEDGDYFRCYFSDRGTTPISLKTARKYLREVKSAVISRDCRTPSGHSLYKWLRPWDVVPKLKNFTPPEGDYGVGVEIELGFRNREGASKVANAVKNWKYVALDVEGPSNFPIEATFAPFLYSKMSSKSQPFRYLKFLRNNDCSLYPHTPQSHTGTHVNVSKAGAQTTSQRRDALNNCIRSLTYKLQCKYFGRRPYGYCYSMGTHLEYKLFNSTTCGRTLRRYIHIAVALTELLTSDREITNSSVLAALEAGYNKR